MRGLILVAFVIGSTAGRGAQTLAPKPSIQYVTVVPAMSASSVAPGGRLTLWADVTPRANVHVYAAGAKDFTPVSLIMTPLAGVTVAKVTYPAPELLPTIGVEGLVPLYRKPFRISQPITIGPSIKSGETLTLAGAVNYQACDDKVCYPATSAPVIWTVTVR